MTIDIIAITVSTPNISPLADDKITPILKVAWAMIAERIFCVMNNNTAPIIPNITSTRYMDVDAPCAINVGICIAVQKRIERNSATTVFLNIDFKANGARISLRTSSAGATTITVPTIFAVVASPAGTTLAEVKYCAIVDKSGTRIFISTLLTMNEPIINPIMPPAIPRGTTVKIFVDDHPSLVRSCATVPFPVSLLAAKASPANMNRLKPKYIGSCNKYAKNALNKPESIRYPETADDD